MENDRLVTVTNRNSGGTGYNREDGSARFFEYNETKQVPLSELIQLSCTYGGRWILDNCLMIKDERALEILNMNVQPEYYYGEEEVRKILFEGDLDLLEDTLNFAPMGVIDLIKRIAVESEIPDIRKRNLISEKTGVNITTVIELNHQMNDDDDETTNEAPVRKTQPINKKPITSTPERKSSGKYKVIE